MNFVVFANFAQDVAEVWSGGGYLMVPLALLALLIYFYAFQLLFYFRRAEYYKVDEVTWYRWIEHPEESKGSIGEMIQYSQEGVKTVRDVKSRFDEIKASNLPPVEGRIVFLSVLVTAAPLMGLLGTVMGMLTTFKGLAHSSGQVVDVVASGISQALITTQTGLIIAIPGYILVSMLTRRRQELTAFLGRLESLSVQYFLDKLVRVQRDLLA
jgi:biopolymer transport protein ExbB